MRSLGLDVGDRRIGVAISDTQGIMARPLTIIERTDDQNDMETINALCKQYEVGLIIAGMPYSMDGTRGAQAEKVQAFIDNLKKYIEVPVEIRDERLSTVSAKRLLQTIKHKHDKKKVNDDAIAAAIILQCYLDERYGIAL